MSKILELQLARLLLEERWRRLDRIAEGLIVDGLTLREVLEPFGPFRLLVLQEWETCSDGERSRACEKAYYKQWARTR